MTKRMDMVPSSDKRKINCAIERKEVVMSSKFAIAEVMPGKLNAMVKTVMNQMGITDANEAVRRINSREWIVSEVIRSWHEQDGVIDLGTVTSDGTTGPKWIKRLEKKGFRVSNWAKSVLNSKDFKPTNGVTSHIMVLKGKLWKDSDRITSNIRAEADKSKFEKPNAEVACLIREKFSDEEIAAMGLWWIVAMHDPIKDSDGGPYLLDARRYAGGRWLHAAYDHPVNSWDGDNGFAFVAPQVST